MPPRWAVASGVGLAQMLAFGTSLYLLTVLSQPIRADTGWPLPWIIGGMSVGQLAGATVAPRVGRWIKRHGGRPALSVSSFLFAGGLGLLAISPNLVVYFAGWMVIGLAMACGLYDTAFGALGRLYGLEARRAITTVTLWGGFASTVFWSLSGVLVTQVGWRWTCGVYALMHLAIALPVYRFLLPAAEPHVEARAKPGEGAAAAAALSDTARAAVVLLGAVLMAETLVASIVSVHLVTLLRERGLTMAAAIGLGVFIGPTQVSARFGESLFGARIHPSLTMIVAVGAITLGVGLLPILPLSVAAVALMSYGAGIGLVSISRGSLPLYLFGPLEAPVISGRLGRPITITAALAPSIGAFLIARMGGATTLWILTAISAISVAAAIALRRLARKMAVLA
ncbi:MAG: proP [Phenylobacterium sp.]|nr:proP [Phenylobacterium sp.]